MVYALVTISKFVNWRLLLISKSLLYHLVYYNFSINSQHILLWLVVFEIWANNFGGNIEFMPFWKKDTFTANDGLKFQFENWKYVPLYCEFHCSSKWLWKASESQILQWHFQLSNRHPEKSTLSKLINHHLNSELTMGTIEKWLFSYHFYPTTRSNFY